MYVQYRTFFRCYPKGSTGDWFKLEDKSEIVKCVNLLNSTDWAYYGEDKFYIEFRIVSSDDNEISLSDTFDLEKDNGLFQYLNERYYDLTEQSTIINLNIKVNQLLEQVDDVLVSIKVNNWGITDNYNLENAISDISIENFNESYFYEGKTYSIEYAVINLEVEFPSTIPHNEEHYGLCSVEYTFSFEGLIGKYSNGEINDFEVNTLTPNLNGTLINIIEPTCTESGYKYYECSVCGEIYDSYYASYLGHTVGEVLEVVNEPNCTEYGCTKYMCSVCDEICEYYISAEGHHFVNGKCSRCGEKEEGTECEHNYKSTVTKVATYKETGIRTYTCTKCEESYTEIIPKLIWNDQNNDKENKTKKTGDVNDMENVTTKSEMVTTASSVSGIIATTVAKKVAKPKQVKIKKIKRKAKSVTVNISKVKKAKGYQVKYGANKKITKNVKTKLVKMTSFSINKLNSSKKYYIKVRAYVLNGKKKVYGVWSKVKVVKRYK